MTFVTHRLVRFAATLLVVGSMAGMTSPARATGKCADKFCKYEQYYVRDGETEVGDRYMFAQSITVTGVHDGDLIAGISTAAVINGVVTGDLVIMGQTVDISGEVQDTARVWTQTLTVTGTIHGDLLFFGSNVTIQPTARIKGSLIGVGGTAIVDGVVDEDVLLTVGQANLNGTIGGDAVVKADAILLADTVSIAGDLRYTARKELDLANTDGVAGEVVFTKKERKPEEPEPFITAGKVLWFAWKSIASMLVGFVLLALGGRVAPRLIEPIRREPMMGTLIGFGSFLVVPAACLLAMVLIISLPLGVIALVIFTVTLYLAKLPVALWLGEGLLSRMGLRPASPFLALALGIVILYLLFSIPFWIGFLVRLAVTWLGLGTMILAVRGSAAAEPA